MSLTLQEGMSVAKFEKKLLKDLKKKSPLACMVLMYESYNWVVGDELYDPQNHEKMEPGHAMLMIGHGRSWSGYKNRFRPFFLFQDSNKNRGNNGYLKMRRGKELIQIFITMKA
uniref:Peptidase C1A papain C-terminal domain-containing protein n=1 Tax=Noccaea caerulescens TaxID=107243 RepID=A0A1J3DWP5_NOCCA